MTTCGSGGKDYVSEICLKLESCGVDALGKMGGATTVGECKNAALRGLAPQDSGSTRSLADIEKGLDGCLPMTDCPGFQDCITTQLPVAPVTGYSCVCTPQPCSCTYSN
jgi:hypothetical protein